MDITLVVGLIAGVIALLGGFLLEGGGLGSILQITAFVIVVGGTVGATVASFTLEDIKRVPSLVGKAFLNREKLDMEQKIEQLVEFSQMARREGLLSLESRLKELDTEPYFRRGIELVVDGVESDLLREMMELELSSMEHRHERGFKIFEAAGGYAPTMGIIGTVMGLINVMGHINSPDELAHGIAVAFNATLYGIATANIIYLPIASKLKEKSKREVMYREMLIEGILAIQSGENPKSIEQKLRAFLDDPNPKNNAALEGE